MLKHIWNIIWNERKHNIGLWLELVVVAVALWYIVDEVYVTLRNYCEPLGFDTQHTYIMHLGILNAANTDYIADIEQETCVAYLRTALDRIQHHPTVEAASMSMHSSPHIGSNRSRTLYRDTLQTKYAVLNRVVTPDFFKVFKYQSVGGSTEELVRALERNELVISSSVEDAFFKNGESAVGKQVALRRGEYESGYRVGAVSTNIRYDNFSKSWAYFAENMSREFLANFVDSYVSILEFCIRVKPEEDHDFIGRFRQDMTQQLRLGNYYLNDIKSIPENKKAFQKDEMNALQIRMFIILFLLINIFLGITGLFWFRTQYRRGEVGLRISLGDTPAGILRKHYLEGLLLLTMAMIPAMPVIYALGKQEILNLYLMDFTLARYFIGFVITFFLLTLMIIGGIWFPVHKAIRVSPAEALRDE